MLLFPKTYLTKSNYKKLSRDAPWRDGSWEKHRIAIDVDSLVFMWMRDGCKAKRCAKNIAKLYTNLTEKNIRFQLVFSNDIPDLKQDLYLERLALQTPYNDRDKIRDKTMKYLMHKYNINPNKITSTTEADKYCAQKFTYVMTEDVDIFLFGGSKTTIVHPKTKRTLKCKNYYQAHGIKTYDMFVDVAIIMGTDYNYGIKGIGVKTIEKIIANNKTVIEYLANVYDLSDPNNAWFARTYFRTLNYLRSPF